MTNEVYIKKMYALGEDLRRAADARPYDPDEYNKVIDAINSHNRVWFRSRRRRPAFFLIVCWVLAILLGLVIMSICC